jgi:hypothetical protein
VIPFEHLSLDTINSAGAITAVYDLVNGPQYINPRYAPSIAPRSPSALAGAAPYTDVPDVLTVDVIGSTAPAAARNLETLISLIEQASEWGSGEATEAVRIRARLQGGTVGDLSAIIIGPASGQSPGTLSPEFDVPAGRAEACWIIRNVELQFLRRGRWLLPRTAATTSEVTNVDTPVQRTITWPSSVRAPSPAAFYHNGLSASFGNTVVLMASSASAILVSAAQGLAGGTGYTSVADAANNPYPAQNNVLRYTAPDTAVNTSAVNVPFPASNPQRRVWAFFAAVRNNSPTASFLLRLRSTNGERTPFVVIPPGSTTPRLIPLGIMGISVSVSNNLGFECQATAAAATLDIAYFAGVAMDDPGAGAVAITPSAGVVGGGVIYSADAFDDRYAAVRFGSFGAPLNGAGQNWAGNADLKVVGDTTSTLILGLNQTTPAQWRMTLAASGSIFQGVTYRPAYLTPQ